MLYYDRPVMNGVKALHEQRESSFMNIFYSKKQAVKVVSDLSPLFRCYLTESYCYIASMKTLYRIYRNTFKTG